MTVTRVYIASPEGANGRNVVAYGMLNALTSKYKTMVFRPAVSNHDEFTPILLAASNAGLGVVHGLAGPLGGLSNAVHRPRCAQGARG